MSWIMRPALLAIVLLSSPIRAAEPDVDFLNPPQGEFMNDWMTVQIAGGKAGYAHSTMSRKGDVVTTRMLTYMKVGRADQPIEISLLQSTRETVSGQPISFSSTTKMATFDQHLRGKVESGKVHLTTSQLGKESTTTIDFPEGARMSWGIFRTSVERGFKPGTTYTLDVYEPSIQTIGAVETRTEIGQRVAVDLLGKSRNAIEVRTTMVLPVTEIPSTGYVDDSGRVLRVDTNVAGIEMTLITVDKRVALAEFDPPEFFMDTLVKIDRRLDRKTLKSAVYKLSVSGEGRKIPKLPKTSMQTPGVRTDRSVTLEVHRLDRAALRDSKPQPPPADLQEYLRASPSLNSDDDAIKKMAATAAGGETHPYRIAEKLRVYVTDTIEDKNLNIGFATASEVCRNREGDCTEHAVLLAALGRARGLPSRVVVGLAFVSNFAGEKNVFGFHMWTQFYIAGQWVDFDAALGETDCSPARIALTTSSLNDFGIGDIAFAILDIVTGLKIEVVSTESR